jgi:hypothetical protein
MFRSIFGRKPAADGNTFGRNLAVDDAGPSFNESMQQGAQNTQSKKPVKSSDRPMTIAERYYQARLSQQEHTAQRITRLITEHIEPLMEIQASSAEAVTHYIFLASDTDARASKELGFEPGQTALQGFVRSHTHVNFPKIYMKSTRDSPSMQVVKIVRLVGDEFSKKWWDDSVIEELEKAIKARMLARGERLSAFNSSFCSNSLCRGRYVPVHKYRTPDLTAIPVYTAICVHRLEGVYFSTEGFVITVEITEEAIGRS